MPATFRRRDLAGLAAAAALARPARAAARPVTVASLLGEDKPETRVWREMQRLLDARSPGRFNLRVVGNAALGGEREVAEGARLGSVQASLGTLAALSGWVPEGQVMDLPFVLRDRAQIGRALAGPTGEDLRARLDAQGFHVLGFINYGARQLLAKEPFTAPGWLKGKRIRVIQSPLHAALWRAFGADPIPVPIPETYNALKTGLADCMDLTLSAYAGFKLYEVVPAIVMTGHIWSIGVIYLSGRYWSGLGADDRAAWTAVGSEAAAFFDRLMVEDEARSLAVAEAAGATTTQPEDRPAWEAPARTVWQAFAPQFGGMGRIEALAAA